MGSLLFYVVDVLLVAVVVAIIAKFKTTRRLPLPPGPPAEPLIGHARLLPKKGEAEFFHEMRKTYGDVIYFGALGRSIVVLNSVEAAVDLLEKRSSIYSDRPRFVMWVDILGGTAASAIMRYGKRFQKHRKLLHSVFAKSQIHIFEEIQTEEARVLLKGLIEARNPDSYNWLVRRFATTIVMKIAYGHQILSDDDEYIKIAENTSLAVAKAGPPGATPPDIWPFLRHVPAWVPGAWWSKFGRDWRFAFDDLFNVPFDRVRKQMANGTAQPSYVATHLTTLESEKVPTEEELDDIKGTAASIYSAGMETTWTSIIMFIFAMTLFPDKQTKAQQEIDRVIGPNRLPEFSDRRSLPYVEAVLQEVMRWYPALPLGLPHSVMEDDIYKGMLIPKGSIILANALSMARDEKVYVDPDKFYPERFLPKSAGGNDEPFPIGTFGFGRRVCPGRYLADASVWMVLATMLSTITISKAKDENGQDIVPEIVFELGLAAKPKDFKCVITPRSEKASSLVMQAVPLRS